MNKEEYIRYKNSIIQKTFVQQAQFEQWLKFFHFIDEQLSKEYDPIYQELYYIKLFEIITTGLEYAIDVSNHLKNGQNRSKQEWFEKFIGAWADIKSILTESELDFIEYKRHNASHIFQNGYELRLNKAGELVNTRKGGKTIEELNTNFMETLIKYGGDKGFDQYLVSKLRPKLLYIYSELTKNRK